MDLDDSILYNSDNKDLESERTNDYTAYQLRSYAFCRAQRIANERLHRLDEFKAVIDQISSEEGLEQYNKLRQEIIGTHAIESDSDKAKQMKKEEKLKHNRKAAQSIMSKMG